MARPAAKLAFDVASVRQNRSDEKPSSNVPLTVGNNFSAMGGALYARNQPLFVYILFAYKVHLNEAWDLLNRLPKWAVTDRFDVVAKSEAKNPTKDEMRAMMQSLLEDRFQLIAHRETRVGAVLGLSVARPGRLGPQMKPHGAGLPCAAPGSAHEPVMTASLESLLGVWPESCEGDQAGSSQRMRAGGRDMTMAEIAAWLSGEGDTDLPIVDRTGLAGSFDLILEFAPEHGPAAASDSLVPTFQQAVRDQLGLRLEREQGAATYFVVDRIEPLAQ